MFILQVSHIMIFSHTSDTDLLSGIFKKNLKYELRHANLEFKKLNPAELKLQISNHKFLPQSIKLPINYPAKVN
jgi:hypothetical protein